MSKERRPAIFLVLAIMGLMVPLGEGHAGTITGTLYELNGTTMITPNQNDTIRVEALDFNMNAFSTAITQDPATFMYTLNIPAPSTADKSVYINVTRKGVVVKTYGPFRGNKVAVQTIDLLVPMPVSFLPPAAEAYSAAARDSQAPEAPVFDYACVVSCRRCREGFFRRRCY